jgi:predicted amidohydrolase
MSSLGIASSTSPCKIALVQMRSGSDVSANTTNCLKSIAAASAAGAKIVFFPECFLYISGGDAPAAQPKPLFTLEHPTIKRFRDAAANHNVWLSLGGFALKNEGTDPRAHNAHALIASNGGVAALYKKIHLFDAAGKHAVLLADVCTIVLTSSNPAYFYDVLLQWRASVPRGARAHILALARGCAGRWKLQRGVWRCRLATTCDFRSPPMR